MGARGFRAAPTPLATTTPALPARFARRSATGSGSPAKTPPPSSPALSRCVASAVRHAVRPSAAPGASPDRCPRRSVTESFDLAERFHRDAISASVMPMPVSATMTANPPSGSRRADTVREPPRWVNFTAFDIRLMKICRSLVASPWYPRQHRRQVGVDRDPPVGGLFADRGQAVAITSPRCASSSARLAVPDSTFDRSRIELINSSRCRPDFMMSSA